MIMQQWNNFEGYQECANTTKLLDVVSIDIFSKSLHEIIDNIDMFGNHSNKPLYLADGPLRECKSIFIKEGIYQPTNSLLIDKFNATVRLLEILKNRVNFDAIITRVYVTILPPGKIIYSHCDASGNYFSTIDRYQFYFTGNKDCVQIIKDNQFSVGPGYFYFFDHRQIHEYKNNSDQDLILMVFDLKK